MLEEIDRAGAVVGLTDATTGLPGFVSADSGDEQVATRSPRPAPKSGRISRSPGAVCRMIRTASRTSWS